MVVLVNYNFTVIVFKARNNAIYLHCTSSVAVLEVFPRLLFATHRYSPLSVLFPFVIVNCFLSAENLNLELLVVSTGDSPMVHDIVGFGFPVALHDKITSSPSVFARLRGRPVISGLSTKENQPTKL